MIKYKFINEFSNIFESVQKGGVCNTSPHIQHVNKCWCDSIITLVIYADGFKERTQTLFEYFNATENPYETIRQYITHVVTVKGTFHLPLNYKNIDTDILQRNHFIEHSSLLVYFMMRRFIRDTELEEERTEIYEQEEELDLMNDEEFQMARHLSGDPGLEVANSIAEQIHRILFYNIRVEDEESIYFSLYPNILRILNYLFIENTNLGLTIEHFTFHNMDDTNPSTIDANLLVGSIGCLVASETHMTCFFNCDGSQKFFDNNNYPTIKDFNWTALLTTIPKENLVLLEINNIDSDIRDIHTVPQYLNNNMEQITHIYIIKHRNFDNIGEEVFTNHLYYYIDQIMYNVPRNINLLHYQYFIQELANNNIFDKLSTIAEFYENADEIQHIEYARQQVPFI